MTKTAKKDNIKSKLAPGTQGTMTMVGSLESLNEPLVALIRLSRGVEMPNLMEIQIPVRFIFVLLTPTSSSSLDCHEIGRAFSTLMSNKVTRVFTRIKTWRNPELEICTRAHSGLELGKTQNLKHTQAHKLGWNFQ